MDILREFGVGKSILEDKIHEEIRYLVDEIALHNGKPIDPHQIIMFAVCNIIGSLTSGSRCDYHDPEFVFHMDYIAKGFQVCT